MPTAGQGAPALNMMAVIPLPLEGLHGTHMLTPAMRVDIEAHLHTVPPPGGILSERGYRLWAGLACNAAGYYRNLVARSGPLDEGALRQITASLATSDEHGEAYERFEYLSGTVAAILSSGVMENHAQVVPEARDLPDVYRMPENALNQFIQPWHRSLARYVVQQDGYEQRNMNARTTGLQVSTLLQLYAWYLALADGVSIDIDQGLACGILKRIMPQGWRRYPIDISCFYIRKLRQMIAIERAIGLDAKRLTGFIQLGMPIALMETYLASKAAKDLDPRRTANSLDLLEPLSAAFGRYYFLDDFNARTDDVRLRNILRGAIAYGQVEKKTSSVVRQMFHGLIQFLAGEGGQWETWASCAMQGELPHWSTWGQIERSRALAEAALARDMEHDISIPLRGIILEHPSGLAIHELRDLRLIDEDTLTRIGYLLHQRVPRGDTLSEASFRFWLGLIANLHVMCNQAYGERGDVEPAAVREYTLRYLECPEDELPSISGLTWILNRVRATSAAGGEKLELPPLPALQVGSVNLAEIDDIASPWQQAIAGFVMEQGAYESGSPTYRYLVEELNTLLRLHDWYTSFIDMDAISRRTTLNQRLVFGIVARLLPERWEKNPIGTGIFYYRKLRQMIALEKGLREGGRLTGYVERAVPVHLIGDFVDARIGLYPGLSDESRVTTDILARIFGRCYYLRNFNSTTSDFPSERAMARLRRILRTMASLGEIAEDLLQAWERIFVDLHFHLLNEEEAWIRNMKDMDPTDRQGERIGDHDAVQPVEEFPEDDIAGDAEEEEPPKDYLRLASHLYRAAMGPTPVQPKAAAAPAAEAGDEHRISAAEAAVAESGDSQRPPHIREDYKFTIPSWFPHGWEHGKGGLLERDTLTEAGLMTHHAARVLNSYLNDRMETTFLVSGVHLLISNIYAAYRALGGKLLPIDRPLIERVAIAFARHGRATDFMEQGRKRAGHAAEFIDLLARVCRREGRDITVPFAAGGSEPLPLVPLGETALADRAEPPPGWAEGRHGCLDIETLMRMRKIDPRTVAKCRELILSINIPGSARRIQFLTILANIVAAYADANGWTQKDAMSGLSGLTRDFVALASRSVRDIKLDDFLTRARNLFVWRGVQHGELYARLEAAELREKLGEEVSATADRIVDEIVAAGAASDRKRGRLLQTLLNIYYYYIESADDPGHLDVPVANAVIAQFASGDDSIARHRERLERIRSEAFSSHIRRMLASMQNPMNALATTWIGSLDRGLEIPGLTADLAQAFVGWALTETSSWVLNMMFSSYRAHLWNVITRWNELGMIPEEAMEALYDAAEQAENYLAGKGLLKGWVDYTTTRIIPDAWREGLAAKMPIYHLIGNRLISPEALAQIDALIEEQGCSQDRVKSRTVQLANVISAYFASGGTLMIPDEALLRRVSWNFALNANVREPRGYHDYSLRSVRIVLDRMRDLASRSAPPSAAGGDEAANSPFGKLLADAGVLATAKDLPTAKERMAEAASKAAPGDARSRRKAAKKARQAMADAGGASEPLQVQGDVQVGVPVAWTSRRTFLSIATLAEHGLLSSDSITGCSRYVAGLRGIQRGERMILPYILANLLAWYACGTIGPILQIDETALGRVLDDLVKNAAMPGIAERRDAYAGHMRALVVSLQK